MSEWGSVSVVCGLTRVLTASMPFGTDDSAGCVSPLWFLTSHCKYILTYVKRV